MTEQIKNSAGYTYMFLMVSSTDGETAVEAASPVPAVEISKNGGAFAASTNAAVNVSDGWYVLVLTPTETNTNGPLVIRATEAASKEWREKLQVIDAVPDVNVASQDSALNANLVTVDATFDGSNFVFDATALEQMTVYLIRYALANIESSGKDTVGGVTMPSKDGQSMGAAIARLVNSFEVDEINTLLTIYETDGETAWFTQTIETSETAKPLTSGTTN